MANWMRTVSNTNGKYCVEMMIDGTMQRVSQWLDTLPEATAIAGGFVAQKAAAEAEATVNTANDGLDRTEEDVYPMEL